MPDIPTDGPGGEWIEYTDKAGVLHRVPLEIAASIWNSGVIEGREKTIGRIAALLIELKSEVVGAAPKGDK
jgi:hypothetical protein